ncbi:MAG: TIGR00725 family protein [Actinobacteria bacterium]|nr:TIGR00725 family protein [Actinomycetota bacterium]
MSHEAIVAVIGEGQCTDDVARAAEEVGRELARRGMTLVCGGLGGVMEAACRGAKSAGGRTVGIIPGDDPSAANRYVDVVIVTGMGEARNALVVKTARAVIAVRGGYGTLSEIALALKTGRPVIGLDTWELSREGVPDQGMRRASSPLEAVEIAVELATRSRR